MPAALVSGTVKLQPAKSKDVRDASGVVVWLESTPDAPVRLESHAAKIVQKEKTFIPHVLAVPVNSSVEFPNFDPIFHNAFSTFDGQIFDVGLYAPGTTRAVKFRRPGVVRVFCNIHPTMSAVIVVLKTPYFAVSVRDGSFRIPDVPPGDYILRIFHERATQTTLGALETKVSVSADTTVPPIRISEAGYITTPHKNKYGKDYPAVREEIGTYPGGHK